MIENKFRIKGFGLAALLACSILASACSGRLYIMPDQRTPQAQAEANRDIKDDPENDIYCGRHPYHYARCKERLQPVIRIDF